MFGIALTKFSQDMTRTALVRLTSAARNGISELGSGRRSPPRGIVLPMTSKTWRNLALTYLVFCIENVQVTVFGDTAIATGGFKAKSTEASGKAFDEHERWTDTWVKMPSGTWQCVATHGSPIEK
jgi:hypothetical protein